MTKLDKPITRVVNDHYGNPLIVTLTAEGITFRRPRKRELHLLPYAAGETRAQTLAAGIGQAVSLRKKSINR